MQHETIMHANERNMKGHEYTLESKWKEYMKWKRMEMNTNERNMKG